MLCFLWEMYTIEGVHAKNCGRCYESCGRCAQVARVVRGAMGLVGGVHIIEHA